MGMGFRINLKWVCSIQSPSFCNSSSWPSSHSFRGMEASYDSLKLSFPSVISGDCDTLYNDHLRPHSCSSAPRTLYNDNSETEEIKMNVSKRSCIGAYNMTDDNFRMPNGEDGLTFLTSLQASKVSHFRLLMNNLNMLEETFSDSDVVRLERDILVQLQRLGALKLCHTCLSRTLTSPTLVKIAVHSGKKEKRKAKRARSLVKASDVYASSFPSKTIHKDPQLRSFSVARSSKSTSRRPKITKNEAEMSRGVKLVVNLERIKNILEEETGQVATLSSWAEAAGIDKKLLHENLHFGWYFRDELLKSTRSLVVYLAKNYRGLGVAFEDLIQAGKLGVLQGAEKFDHSRGYKFSTYIQYWIRKSMLILVERNARGVRIPYTLSKAINKIQKARKAMCNSHGKYPDDDEIAKFTGLSIAKITSASKCLRIVGSLDQKIGDVTSAKLLEFTPDASVKTPEETITRKHMVRDIYDLLNGLDPREREVLILRFGLHDHRRKSLQEIGRLSNVSKEWIRKIERAALTKLKDKEIIHNLNYYLYM